VDEALSLIRQYNIDFANVSVHFHIADVSGNSAVVEYVDDGISIVRGEQNWQVSTNYLFSEPVQPNCWRYKKASETLAKEQGDITNEQAMDILQGTSQDTTTWSVVYNLSTGGINLAMGKDYDDVHTYKLSMKSQN
jgi:penicillin V acylase-like amidase (Ntn superfamily)